MTNESHVDKSILYSSDLYDYYTSSSVWIYDYFITKRICQIYMANGAGRQLLLDVGTGTARLLIKMSRMPEFAALEMIGTDYFEDMIVKARRNVVDAGLNKRIRIKRDDVHAMQFHECFCDLLMSRSAVHHWRNPIRAFQEIYRVMKPGGIAIIHDIRRDAPPNVKAQFQRARAALGVPLSNFDEKYTQGEIKQMLMKAGLSHCTSVTAPNSGPAALGFEIVVFRET